ncbi:MAG: hypothetical protein IH609_11895 [Dehalococcoidia bacterium]|nr:hypothetical protein [Dehalococcoidia bacterium]
MADILDYLRDAGGYFRRPTITPDHRLAAAVMDPLTWAEAHFPARWNLDTRSGRKAAAAAHHRAKLGTGGAMRAHPATATLD